MCWGGGGEFRISDMKTLDPWKWPFQSSIKRLFERSVRSFSRTVCAVFNAVRSSKMDLTLTKI